jgi:hypothetical protein
LVLIERSSTFDLLPTTCPPPRTDRHADLPRDGYSPPLLRRLKVTAHRCDVERARVAKRPRERPPPLGEVETAQVGVQGRAPARTPARRIGDDARLPGAVHHYHETQQIGLGRPLPAAYAKAHGRRAIGHMPV